MTGQVATPMVVIGSLFAAVVHLLMAGHHLESGTWLGAAFVANGLAFLGVAMAVASAGLHRRWVRLAAVGVSLATAVAFVASKTVAVGDLGHTHWAQLGLLTTAVEVVIALAAWGLTIPGRRRVMVPLLAAVLGVPVAVTALPGPNAPEGCVEPNRRLTLYAEELPRDPDGKPRLGYGLTPTTASTPGPLIEMVEGECLAVTLVNHVSATVLEELRADDRWPGAARDPLGVSLHVHGVKYTPLSDGTVHSGSYVPPGGARTYIWYAAPRATTTAGVTSSGTAGYWWYHDHVAGTSHGSGGLDAGLWGGMVVRRPADLRPDHTYVVGMGGRAPMINHRRGGDAFVCDRNGNTPADDCFVATRGQRVEFLVIGVPGWSPKDDFHTFHLHGHNWANNRTGMLTSAGDETALIDARVIGPSESFGFQVVAGDSVGAGDWMLHCHVNAHSDAGMATYFRVLGAGGVPAPVPASATSSGVASVVASPAVAGHDHSGDEH